MLARVRLANVCAAARGLVQTARVSAPDDKDEHAGLDIEIVADHKSTAAEAELELFREPDPDDGDDAPDGAVALIPPPRAAEPDADEPDEPEREPAMGGTMRLPQFEAPERFAARPLRLLVVGGARGGVGKTVLAANLGLYLSTIGRRVVLVDADAAGANLHTCLGTAASIPLNKLRRQARTSEAPRAGTPLAEALHETPFRGLRLLHLGLDEPALGYRAERVAKLMGGLRDLDAEYVVVDLGVGVGKEALDNYLGADLSLFVTVPEPTAIENTYRFLRGAFVRYLLRETAEDDARGELERRARAMGGAPPPIDLLQELIQEDHPLAPAVQSAMERFRPHVVINQTRLRADLDLGFAMQSAARRRLGIVLDYVGHIDHDDTVWTCVRNRRPLLLEVPGAKSSRKIEKIARHLLMLDSGKAQPPRLSGVPTSGHHDLLEIERGASDEDIRRAYKRCREVYSRESLSCYGLFEPHEIEKLRARIDEAFDVLVDPARRRPYELSVFPDEPEPQPAPSEVFPDEPLRPPPDITPDTQFTGTLLRHVRESHRITLHEIHQRTKISLAYLKAIEDDDFSRLPEVVYTSGFLREMARHLKLDAQQVSRTYVSRYKRYLDDKARAFARKQ